MARANHDAVTPVLRMQPTAKTVCNGSNPISIDFGIRITAMRAKSKHFYMTKTQVKDATFRVFYCILDAQDMAL